MTNGGVLVKRCGLSFEELCKYKYLLNVGSNGYANKLKYLFLTGSVVIWVKKDSLNCAHTRPANQATAPLNHRHTCLLAMLEPRLHRASLPRRRLKPAAHALGSHLRDAQTSSSSINFFRMCTTCPSRLSRRCLT